VLDQADCVFTIGFDAVEYDPCIWNAESQRKLVALDVLPVLQDNDFLPDVELVGDISATLSLLTPRLSPVVDGGLKRAAEQASEELAQIVDQGAALEGSPVPPLRLVYELRKIITDKTLVALDVGSHYIWMNRYLAADFARQVFVSNGQQTLGVALPWAIALSLMHPDK
jgi:acetolactate synthase-1/2/3 large subunit